MKGPLILTLLAALTAPAIAAHRGALVTKVGTEDQPVAGSFFKTSWTFLKFGEVQYDTDRFFDPAKPDTFTIPGGVSKVRLQCQVIFEHNPEGFRQAVIAKDGKLFDGFAAENKRAIGGTTTDMNITSPILPVKQGDTFQCSAWQMQGEDEPSLNVKGYGGVWFQIEVIE